MNKEQTQQGPAVPLVGYYPSANLTQYAAKVSADRGLLAASCYLIPKLHNGDVQRELHRKKETKREKKGEEGVKRVSLHLI